MNLNLARKIDNAIETVMPIRAERRSRARALNARNKLLEASYNSATPTLQRGARSSITYSESGQLTQSGLDGMREWSRDLFRNNSLYSGMFRRGADNIVGTGIEVNPKSSDDGLNKELKAAFQDYTKAGGGWEVTGRFSFVFGQRLALYGSWRDGDLLLYRSDDGWQFFEGGQIGTPTGYDTQTMRIISGIQVDALNRPAYYWVSDYSKYGYIDGRSAKGLRADKCRHIANWEWASGVRGIPVHQNSLGKFEDLDRYLEAELLGAMAAACIMGEINSPQTDANALKALSVNRGTEAASTGTSQNPRKIEMAPAQVIHTYNDEEFKLHVANRPSAAFPDYVRTNIRILGAPLGMPLEIATMDFTQTNFAAAKMAMTQAMLTVLFWQEAVIRDQFIAPIYRDWIATQRDVKFTKKIEHVARFEVIPPKSEWLDPYKEALALNEGLDGRWDTLTRIAKDVMGRELEDIFNDRINEMLLAKKLAKENGLPEADVLQWIDRYRVEQASPARAEEQK